MTQRLTISTSTPARGGVMMHIMNGQLMAAFIDDNKDSVNN
jgi:hypothetical protein